MQNPELVKIFTDIAEILEVRDENPFRIRAYQKVAALLEVFKGDLKKLAENNELTNIQGIGKDLAGKIEEYIKTGKIEFYEELLNETPKVLLDMMTVPGIGPKTAKLLYNSLKFETLEELEILAASGKLRSLPSIKEKTEENIIKGIEFIKKSNKLMLYPLALEIATSITEDLRKQKFIEKADFAGSLRRGKERIRDIDILISSKQPKKVMDYVTTLSIVKEIIAHGQTKSTVRINFCRDGSMARLKNTSNIQIDFRVVDNASYGSALCYFTGSTSHNIHLRKLAISRGQKISEYGVFNKEKKLAGTDENKVYKSLGLQFIPPEIREDQGEIELAQKNKVPKLVELKDMLGDFHVHSRYSDGKDSIQELVVAAQSLGYKYLAIADHSTSLKVAGGIDEKDLFKKFEEIDRINSTLKDFKILKASEIEILSDGTLDYSDDVLKQLDIVIAAVHTGFKQSKSVLTKRIINAMKNKHVHIMAHLTCRLFGSRDACDLDIEEILNVAKDTNTALEINASPQRLDVNDVLCKLAKDKGIKLAIGTDAHSIEQLNNMKYGINIARRAWLTKDDIINTIKT